MSFLSRVAKIFGAATSSAPVAASASRNVARERLSVILASQRGSELLAGVDMDKLQQDVLNVVKVRHIYVRRHYGLNRLDSISHRSNFRRFGREVFVFRLFIRNMSLSISITHHLSILNSSIPIPYSSKNTPLATYRSGSKYSYQLSSTERRGCEFIRDVSGD